MELIEKAVIQHTVDHRCFVTIPRRWFGKKEVELTTIYRGESPLHWMSGYPLRKLNGQPIWQIVLDLFLVEKNETPNDNTLNYIKKTPFGYKVYINDLDVLR